jgi:hypothetical protein
MINVKLTVPALREIAATMNITIPSKARKDDIVALINEGINTAHSEAIELAGKIDAIDKVIADKDERRVSLIKDIVAGYRAQTAREKMARKINAYIRSNGTDKMTKAQGRRIRKGLNKSGIKLSQLSFTFP